MKSQGLRLLASRSTGIYREVHLHAETSAAMEQLFEYLELASNLDHVLETIEERAKTELDQNAGSSSFPIKLTPSELAALPPSVRDADAILWSLLDLRDAVHEGRINDAVLAAIKLGEQSERLSIRRFERLTDQGRRVTDGGRKGAQIVLGTEEQRMHERGQFQLEYLRQRDIGKNHTEACCWCAKKFGVCSKTIDRHVANPTPKLRKKKD